jgi:DNA-binding NtrC family response regulator
VLTFPVGTALAEIEREAISRTLEHFGGNKARAAAALEIDASTLYRKLKRQRSGA